jgi:hypothetical protein
LSLCVGKLRELTNALPIIGRELRLQSRRRSTVWLRFVAAGLACLAAIAILTSTTAGRVGGVLPGQAVFKTLSIVIFVACLFEGVRQTSDCLSSEKREGTLSLLFLTDLKAFDVVLGKLAATSVNSFYALLAIFPSMAMALPYGGVTAGEFWRTQLALLDALFFGLAVGMWASAGERDAKRTWTAGFSVAALLTVVPLMWEMFLKRGPIPNMSPAVALGLAGDAAYSAAPARYWLTLLTVHALGWELLILASRRLQRTWQDKERPATVEALMEQSKTPDTGRWAPEGEPVWTEDFSAYRNARPEIERPARALLDGRHTEWLASWLPQHRFLAGLAIYLLALGTFGGAILGSIVGFGVIGISSFSAITWLTALLPWLLLAYVASRPMAEARRSGEFELLLSTPLPPADLVTAHWKSLWRQISAPFKVSCIIIGVMALFSLSAVVTSGRFSDALLFPLFHVLTCFGRIVTGVAVCRMGFYYGLKAKSMVTAVAFNLFWAVVVPGLALFVIRALQGAFFSFLPGAPAGGLSVAYWGFSLFTFMLGIAYAVFLIRWSHQKLAIQFRSLAASVG